MELSTVMSGGPCDPMGGGAALRVCWAVVQFMTCWCIIERQRARPSTGRPRTPCAHVLAVRAASTRRWHWSGPAGIL